MYSSSISPKSVFSLPSATRTATRALLPILPLVLTAFRPHVSSPAEQCWPAVSVVLWTSIPGLTAEGPSSLQTIQEPLERGLCQLLHPCPSPLCVWPVHTTPTPPKPREPSGYGAHVVPYLCVLEGNRVPSSYLLVNSNGFVIFILVLFLSSVKYVDS